jgi:DNA-binding IclR family transcriptional regulator
MTAKTDRRIRLTSNEIAARIGKHLGAVQAILDELERDGLAERDGDGNHWKLTKKAAARFGTALRDLRQL